MKHRAERRRESAKMLRDCKPRKQQRVRPYRGPILVTTNMARAAELSPKANHVKFTAELEAERKKGRGRLFRGMLADHRAGWRERFGNIANRTDYQRRRGR